MSDNVTMLRPNQAKNLITIGEALVVTITRGGSSKGDAKGALADIRTMLKEIDHILDQPLRINMPDGLLPECDMIHKAIGDQIGPVAGEILRSMISLAVVCLAYERTLAKVAEERGQAS